MREPPIGAAPDAGHQMTFLRRYDEADADAHWAWDWEI